MTTLTGRCMPLVEVQVLPSIARATDMQHQQTLLQKRCHIIHKLLLLLVSMVFSLQFRTKQRVLDLLLIRAGD